MATWLGGIRKGRVNFIIKILLAIIFILGGMYRFNKKGSDGRISRMDLTFLKGNLKEPAKIIKGSHGYRSIEFSLEQFHPIKFSNGGLFYTSTNRTGILNCSENDTLVIGILDNDFKDNFINKRNTISVKNMNDDSKIEFYSLTMKGRELVNLEEINREESEKTSLIFIAIPFIVIILLITALKDIKLL